MNRNEKDMPMYMIGIVAKMLSVHPQTLRLYEREGLITPCRSSGKTRLYSRRDVERARFIIHLTRDMGVNLAGVEIILRLKDQMDEMQKEMEELLNYIREELKKEVSWMAKKTRVSEERDKENSGKKVIKIKAEKAGGDRYAD